MTWSEVMNEEFAAEESGGGRMDYGGALRALVRVSPPPLLGCISLGMACWTMGIARSPAGGHPRILAAPTRNDGLLN